MKRIGDSCQKRCLRVFEDVLAPDLDLADAGAALRGCGRSADPDERGEPDRERGGVRPPSARRRNTRIGTGNR
ncbi:MAG TPA: hypothetical protein VGB47_02575 [Thermoanaerobaculia bacterium]